MKRLRLLGIVVAIIVVGWLVVHVFARREPQYEGRTLTQWVEDSKLAYAQSGDPEHPERNSTWLASSNALAHVAKDAIPFLLEDLAATESRMKPKISAAAKQKVIAAVLKRKWINQLQQAVVDDNVKTFNRHMRGMYGFALLRRNAKAAEPSLIRLTNDTDPSKRLWGFMAFGVTTPEKGVFVPVASKLLHDPDAEIQNVASQTLHNLYPEEAERAGVYKLFPELRSTNALVHMHIVL